ncbi:restriction endonuclease subunit S [Megasphaera elsdenii]|uniref:restriction endonuclease subunit S n=1 Tax=Megasphaera elsdenii TaxID=907 RepID=UPI002E75F882|nr:restriction endonuclease subunit S [Megasphaera elsdenii]MEE0404390.1 restriction endonuclease subunit S [Megasphaera elsdenii]
MNAQDLKNSILQRAIEGKLVPQRAEEGTARDLLAEIRAEKEKLIREKKIKKTKPLPEISDDEKPFEIPESWEWVRFEDIFEIARGGSPRPIKQFLTQSHDGINWIKIGDTEIGDKYIVSTKEKIIPKGLSKSRLVEVGDLLLTNSMSYGRPYILKTRGAIHDGWLVLSPYFEKINKEFFYYIISSPYVHNQFARTVSGAVVKNLNKDKVKKIFIPLPPLVEQYRIVARIEELQPDIDAYDKAHTELRTIEQRFPDDMKKSLLQYAIEGKLVPQRKEEGTARDLLAEIRAEKEKLIKAKKIKKTKPLPEITDDEKPFDIPDSWEWVRLEEIGSVIGGGTPKTKIIEYWDGTIPWITPADMKFIGKYAKGGKRNISSLGLQKSSAQLMPKGTVLFSSRAPIGYIAIADNDISTNQGFKSIVPFDMRCNEYIYYCLQARLNDIKHRASGTTFKEISGAEFGKTMIPFPPLAEQHRIVARIEELLPLCRQLASEPE